MSSHSNFHGRMRWLAFGLVYMSLLVVSGLASCPISSCSIDDPNLPSVWVNTSRSATRVTGLSYTIYPRMQNGEAFLRAYSEINLTAIQELQPFVAGDKCYTVPGDPGGSGDHAMVLRELDWSQLCCETRESWDLIESNINRTSVTVSITDPEDPEFLLTLAMHVVNESVSYLVQGTPNTGGEDFNISYSKYSSKQQIDLVNWPWVGKNLTDGYTNPSYLKIFLIGIGVIDEIGNLTIWDKGLSAFYSASTSRVYTELDFLKVVNLDGIDYALSLSADVPRTAVNIYRHVSAPFTITGCQDKRIIMDAPYWTNFSYDPSLTALYNGVYVEQTPQITPEKIAKSRLHPAAYAVPIAVVGFFIVALVAATILSPSFRQRMRPFSKRSETST